MRRKQYEAMHGMIRSAQLLEKMGEYATAEDAARVAANALDFSLFSDTAQTSKQMKMTKNAQELEDWIQNGEHFFHQLTSAINTQDLKQIWGLYQCLTNYGGYPQVTNGPMREYLFGLQKYMEEFKRINSPNNLEENARLIYEFSDQVLRAISSPLSDTHSPVTISDKYKQTEDDIISAKTYLEKFVKVIIAVQRLQMACQKIATGDNVRAPLPKNQPAPAPVVQPAQEQPALEAPQETTPHGGLRKWWDSVLKK